jgi:hypothetical protein
VGDHDVDAGRDRVEPRREERLAAAAGCVERPVVEPRLPRRAPDPQSEELDPGVLQVVAPKPIRDAPLLDRLIVVAGHQDDLRSRHAVEPVLELAGEECLLRDKVALERVRHVAGDEKQVTRRDLDEVLVQVGGAVLLGGAVSRIAHAMDRAIDLARNPDPG